MITPKELDGIDTESILKDERQALIDFIDNTIKRHPGNFCYEIYAIGIMSGIGWEDRAELILKEYEAVGWKISEIRCFYSFRTRVEFNICKR